MPTLDHAGSNLSILNRELQQPARARFPRRAPCRCRCPPSASLRSAVPPKPVLARSRCGRSGGKRCAGWGAGSPQRTLAVGPRPGTAPGHHPVAHALRRTAGVHGRRVPISRLYMAKRDAWPRRVTDPARWMGKAPAQCRGEEVSHVSCPPQSAVRHCHAASACAHLWGGGAMAGASVGEARGHVSAAGAASWLHRGLLREPRGSWWRSTAGTTGRRSSRGRMRGGMPRSPLTAFRS
jgi:hypothetical protein